KCLAARDERLKLAPRPVEILPEQGHPILVAGVEIQEIGEMPGAMREILTVFDLCPGDKLLKFRRSVAQLHILGFPRRLGQRAFSRLELLQPGHKPPSYW